MPRAKNSPEFAIRMSGKLKVAPSVAAGLRQRPPADSGSSPGAAQAATRSFTLGAELPPLARASMERQDTTVWHFQHLMTSKNT